MLPDEARAYVGQARLVAPGIGNIILRSSLPAKTDDGLKQALVKQRKLCDTMNVPDLAAARARQIAASEIESDLRELQASVTHLVPLGLAALREEVAVLRTTIAVPCQVEEDPVEAGDALISATNRVHSARQALRAAEQMQGVTVSAFVDAETALAALQAEETQIDAVLGLDQDREARAIRMTEDLSAFQDKVTDAQAHAEKLRASTVDLASAEAAVKRAQSVDQAVGQEIHRLREEVAGLNATIEARCDNAVEEKWREVTEALAVAEMRAQQFAKESRVLQTLHSTLENARSQARDLYLKPVMTSLKPLLGLLFHDVSITFDEKTLLPQTILRRGLEEQVDRLSGGMKEQLSVLTQLAFARLLTRDGRPTPVILDDALVYSDDDRIERMFDALHRQAIDQQNIVFSCRQRAFQRLGGNILSMVDWKPDDTKLSVP